MDFLIDPFMVAVPKIITTYDQLDEYSKKLKEWTALKKTKGHKFWFTVPLMRALVDDNCYPVESNFKLSCKNMKIDVIAVNDAARAAEMIEPIYLEDVIDDVEIDHKKIESIVLPDEIQNRLSPAVALALKQSLVEIAISGANSDFARNILIASKPLPTKTSEVTVNVNQNPDQGLLDSLTASWRLVSDPSELDEIQDLKNIWENTERCVAQAYEQLCKIGALDRKLQKCPKITAGEGFSKSVKALHLDNQPVVLASIFTNMVMGIYDMGAYKRTKKAETGTNHHALQDRPNHQAVRETDNAAAWRIYLSGSYRLHYWLLPDGSAELSKVGVHPDMKII